MSSEESYSEEEGEEQKTKAGDEESEEEEESESEYVSRGAAAHSEAWCKNRRAQRRVTWRACDKLSGRGSGAAGKPGTELCRNTYIARAQTLA